MDYYLRIVLNYFKIVLFFFRDVIREFWWLFALIFLGKIFINLSRQYKTKKKKEEEEIKDWVSLEIKVNREILQTPKSMEQVFNALNIMKKGYMSFEIVGIDREMHFIINCQKEYKNLIESQLYAQYPEIEIRQIDDYFLRFSPHLPNREFDLWGTEIVFEKDNYYPIKTYSYFEELKEEKRIDPIASLAESIAKLQKQELSALQIFVKPLSENEEKKWREEGKDKIDEVMGKKKAKDITWQDWVAAFFKNLILAIVQAPVWPSKEEKEGSSASLLSSGEKDIIKAIEKKLSQLSFNIGIRIIYIAPKTIFNEINCSGFIAFLRQFNTKDLNAFEINEDSSTVVKSKLFQNRKLFFKKRDFYQSVLKRKLTRELIILSAEELATIYHFPFLKIKAPALTRVLSKKGEPPAGLPVG